MEEYWGLAQMSSPLIHLHWPLAASVNDDPWTEQQQQQQRQTQISLMSLGKMPHAAICLISRMTAVLIHLFNQLRHFLKSTQRDKPSPLNLTRYAVLPHNTEIVLWPQVTVTSLHPMHINVQIYCWLHVWRLLVFTSRCTTMHSTILP